MSMQPIRNSSLASPASLNELVKIRPFHIGADKPVLIGVELHVLQWIAGVVGWLDDFLHLG